jgi:hypothetical protein
MLGYESDEVLARSVIELRNYASQTRNGLTEAEQRAQQLERDNAELRAAIANGTVPGAGAAPVDPLTTLNDDFHIPGDLIRQAVDSRVRAALGETLGPILAAVQVDQQMTEKYGPSYAAMKPRIDAFTAQNPRVAEMVRTAAAKGVPELGAEYALSKFMETALAGTHASMISRAADTRATTETERLHAGPLAGREHTRTAQVGSPTGDIQALRRDAAARAQRGDWTAFEKLIAASLPSEDALQRLSLGHTDGFVQ